MKYLTPLTIAIAIASISCDGRISVDSSAKSSSGVTRKATQVATDADGWTQEQKNIADRLKVDNTPGAIKHLYIISPYSGQTIFADEESPGEAEPDHQSRPATSENPEPFA